MAAFDSPWRHLQPPPLETQGDLRLFALFDAAQIDRFRHRTAGLPFLAGMASVYPPPLAPDRFDATPHLAEMADIATFKNAALMLDRAGASHGAMTWLTCPLPLEQLARRLRNRLDARLPEDFDCVNRFYDGRVLPHLHACLSDEQRAAFFACADQWGYVTPSFEWRMLSCHFDKIDPYQPPLRLDERQEASMIDACYPYAVIEHFERTDPELLDSIPANARYGHFEQALQAAKRFGIDGGESAILFCTLSLTRGAKFHEAEDWQADLSRVRDGQTQLQEVVKARHD